MNYELVNGSIIEDEQQSSIMEKLMELKPHSSIDYSWDDIGMATLMSDIYASELRYCPQNGKWYSWDGCWRKQGDNGLVSDKLQTMLNLLRLYQREISADESLSEEEREVITNYEKYLRTTRKFTSMKNILETLKTVMPIRLSLQDMDSNPYLLNTERGAYDLKTGGRVADVRPFNVTKKSATSLPDFTLSLIHI